MDKLYLMLLISDEFNLLPEMIDIFGRGKILKFLTVFSGMNVKVPDKKSLEQTARDIHIVSSLRDAKKFKKVTVKSVLTSLANEYGVSESSIKVIEVETLDKLNKYGVTIIEDDNA